MVGVVLMTALPVITYIAARYEQSDEENPLDK